MDNPVVPERRGRFWLVEGLLLLGLLALALKLTYHIAAVRDIGMGDEAAYMSLGLLTAERGVPPATANPLYCLWYLSLSHIQPDRAKLYFLSWSVLAALLTLSIYV